MNCKETILELSAYLDNEVAETTRVSIESHVASCSACRARLDELRRISHGIAALPHLPAPAAFADDVRRRIRAAHTPPPSPSWWDWLITPAWMKLPLQAVALIALFIGIAMLVQTDRPQSRTSIANMKKMDVARRNESVQSSPIPGEAAWERDQSKSSDLRQKEEQQGFGDKPLPTAPPAPSTPLPEPPATKAKDVLLEKSAVAQTEGISAPVATPAAADKLIETRRRDSPDLQQPVVVLETVETPVMEVASLDLALVRQQVALLTAELNGQIVPQPADDSPEKEGKEIAAGDFDTKKGMATASIMVDLPASQLERFKSTLNHRMAGTVSSRETGADQGKSVTSEVGTVAGSTAPAPVGRSTSSTDSPTFAKIQTDSESNNRVGIEAVAAQKQAGQSSKPAESLSEPRALLDITNALPVIGGRKAGDPARITLIIKVVPPSSPAP
jgi:hypothetical protein